MEAVSEPETLSNEKVFGENIEQKEGSIPEIVEDQTVTLKHELCTNETVISKPQQVTNEENLTEAQQNGDSQVEIKPSQKSKSHNRRKASMEGVSESVTHQKVLGENIEQKEGSLLEIVEDQIDSLKNEINTVISKTQQVTEEEQISETQQNGNQQVERKLSKKSSQKDKKLQPKKVKGRKSKTETVTSPPQMEIKVKEDVVPTTPQGSEKLALEELSVQDNRSEQKKGPVKKVSVWRKIKKAMTPSHRRQYKDRGENHHQ